MIRAASASFAYVSCFIFNTLITILDSASCYQQKTCTSNTPGNNPLKMTRVTNFGIKRTYLQAGFSGDDASNSLPADQPATSSKTAGAEPTTGNGTSEGADNGDTAPRPKKKRKRTPMSKRDGYAAQRALEAALLNGEEPPKPTPAAVNQNQDESTKEPKPYSEMSKSAKKKKRNLDRKKKSLLFIFLLIELLLTFVSVLDATEARRLRRIEEKASATICFACRETGHAAKNCPKNSATNGEKGVGICYRCVRIFCWVLDF